MTKETPKEKKLLDEMKAAVTEKLEVEQELDEKGLDAVSGGECRCQCGIATTCGGGGGGGSESAY